MKNLNKLFVVLCIGLLLFATSCDKATEGDPNGGGSAFLLTKITWQWVNEEGITENDIATLEYDSQSRLSKIKEIYDDTTTYESILTYDANGKLSQEMELDNGVETDKTTYTWTATNVTELYSSKEGNVWVDDYKYVSELNSDGLITKEEEFYKQDNVWLSDSYYLYTWANGNNTKEEEWYLGNMKSSVIKHLKSRHHKDLNVSGLKSANDTKQSTYTYMYDDKNNAFSSLGFWDGTEALNKNNVTKSTRSYAGQPDEVDTYTYEYNSDNYPTKSTATYPNGDGTTDTEIALFEYTTR
jgi:hypothetical protein